MKRILLIVVFSLFFVGCQKKDDSLITNITKIIDNNSDKSGSYNFNMKDATDFEWDKMVIYEPNCSNSDISVALGVSFRDSTDLIGGMVFVYKNKIVHKEKSPFSDSNEHPNKHPKLTYIVDNEPGKPRLKVLTPDNAVFEGKRTSIDGKSYDIIFHEEPVFDITTKYTMEDLSSDWIVEYSSVISDYRSFWEGSLENGLENMSSHSFAHIKGSDELEYRWGCMLVEAYLTAHRNFSNAKEAFGYALRDLNNNGRAELILLLKDYTVLAVYSMANETPKLLDAFWPRYSCGIGSSGKLYTSGSSGAGLTEHQTLLISQNDNELVLVEEFGNRAGVNNEGIMEDCFYKIVDGKEYSISRAEHNDLYENFPKLNSENRTAYEITKNSGIEFIPLFDE